MLVKKAYKFRLYPDSKREKLITEQLSLSKNLYNKLLEKTIDAYKQDKKAKINKSKLNQIMKEILSENKDYLKIYSQTRQNIFVRLQMAYQNFFRRVMEKNKKPGFPRFRSSIRYKSITYPQNNGSFKIERIKKEDRLRISRIGTVKIKLHRKIEGKIKTMSIKREAGKYYATFSTEYDVSIPKIENTSPVGIDVGLKTFVVLSDKKIIQKPKFAREKEKKLHHWERVKARRIKGSKNRYKALLKIQRTWAEINNQNNDFIQKETTRLVNCGNYTSFIMEDLKIQNMLKNHKLARSINEAIWGKFKMVLSCKAESAGMKVISVPAEYTTQTCSRCLNVKQGEEKMRLNDRIYYCHICGLVMDRDENSSINIKRLGTEEITLKRAREGHSQSNASGDLTSTVQQASHAISMNQEHTLQMVNP
jgi:putative transposase